MHLVLKFLEDKILKVNLRAKAPKMAWAKPNSDLQQPSSPSSFKSQINLELCCSAPNAHCYSFLHVVLGPCKDRRMIMTGSGVNIIYKRASMLKVEVWSKTVYLLIRLRVLLANLACMITTRNMDIECDNRVRAITGFFSWCHKLTGEGRVCVAATCAVSTVSWMWFWISPAADDKFSNQKYNNTSSLYFYYNID